MAAGRWLVLNGYSEREKNDRCGPDLEACVRAASPKSGSTSVTARAGGQGQTLTPAIRCTTNQAKILLAYLEFLLVDLGEIRSFAQYPQRHWLGQEIHQTD